ncbi:hypothetical protein EWM64_g3912 [Hericium alpestre]|uniref:DUF221-domain-containing protein n=1 Tax=Hericium alpestre TaxID=135208 RepID=A0A4Z0A1C5_9AGAM|nr:hypothetical protein EWM64_g3912 [Hericium alpestre]
MSGVEQVFSENVDSRTLAPAAVASQLALMGAVSGITIIHTWLSDCATQIVYEPKVKYHVGNKKPPKISDSIFGWVPPLLHTKEPELVEKLGLDAATFLRFGRMIRWIFSGIAVVACAVLIPVNIVYNLRKVPKEDRDILSMMTIRDVGGNLLFVHVGVTYLITAFVMVAVWMNWRQMVILRRNWFRSPEYMEAFYARTLAVTNVPKKYQSDEGIRAVFETVQVPYPTTSVHVGRKVGRLPELIEYHNETVRQFEQVLVRYLKGGKIAKERPTIRIGGFMGMGGVKKDAIDYYTDKLQRTERAVEEYRDQIDNRKPENYGFASMAAVPYAHVVAQILRKKHPKGTTIQLAPNPKDIVWENLRMTDGERMRKRTMGWFLLFIVCFFNTIPLFIISVLANLSSVASFVPFLFNWSKSSPKTFDFISGVLPPTVSALFGFFLPITMRWLSAYQGATTHSRLDRAVLARYFAFLVISQLVIFTLIGVIFNSVSSIIKQIGQHKSFDEIMNNLDKLPGQINTTYINQASYWLTFFPLRGFLVLFDLAQILNLIWISFKKRVMGRTPRDIRDWTQPPEFQFSIYYSNISFMCTVGLVFAPIAPLVAVAAAVVLWISSFVNKYQLMFVFISKVETGGRMWNPVVNRLLFSTMMMQALMVLTIGLQYGWRSFAWVATIPAFIFVIFFKMYLDRTFERRFRYFVPTEDELRHATKHTSKGDIKGNRLSKRFGHPALHAELFTPMLHAKMMPLLSEVYRGKISQEQTKMEEYGGQQMDAQVLPGGLRIAAIHQRDLEYDPAQYQRDRGELDWDAGSVSTANMLSDSASVYPSKSQFYVNGRGSPAPSGRLQAYDRYLQHGPQQSEIELSRLDLPYTDQQPLLPPGSRYNAPSTSSLPGYDSPVQQYPPQQYPPPPGVAPAYIASMDDFREAPLHRPYPSRQGSQFSHAASRSGDLDQTMNVAGRGAYRG